MTDLTTPTLRLAAFGAAVLRGKKGGLKEGEINWLSQESYVTYYDQTDGTYQSSEGIEEESNRLLKDLTLYTNKS